MADYEYILVERIGKVCRILHNRPERRNAEGRQLLTELESATQAADSDPDISVIIIGGVGTHFSAGHDLKEAEAERPNLTLEQRWEYEFQHFYKYCVNIFDLRKPTIAQVQGACLAGAFVVANMCDLVVASEEAFFSDPVAQSLGVAGCEVLVHPWVLGMRKAKEILYTGRRFTAAEALEMGMINRMVPRPELEDATLELANQIACAPPFGMQLLKKSLNRTLEAQGFRVALNAHFDSHLMTHYTSGFLEKTAGGLSGGIKNTRDHLK
jgi:enoyl-CoA hydratase